MIWKDDKMRKDQVCKEDEAIKMLSDTLNKFIHIFHVYEGVLWSCDMYRTVLYISCSHSWLFTARYPISFLVFDKSHLYTIHNWDSSIPYFLYNLLYIPKYIISFYHYFNVMLRVNHHRNGSAVNGLFPPVFALVTNLLFVDRNSFRHSHTKGYRIRS